MSEVWLVRGRRGEPDEAIARAVAALWSAAGLESAFAERDLAAIKLHVGEPGCRTHVEPGIVAALVQQVAGTGARPFLTDTAVLYKSPRSDGLGHALVAARHGFGVERVGAPFLPADGLRGEEEVEVRVDGRHFQEVALAAGVLQASSMLVLSHATGHLGTGMGAALKNLGMGCASRKGKLRQHHGQQPRIDGEACVACGECALWCPTGAITVDEVAAIDAGTCIGCGECIAACRYDAVDFDWGIMGAELQERVVEHAAGVVRRKRGHLAYVTVATAITRDCDCMGLDQEPLVPDIGLLASRDPVAIDQAVLDLVRRSAGRTLESMSYPGRDASVQVAYAEAMGLGSRDYELVEVPATGPGSSARIRGSDSG